MFKPRRVLRRVLERGRVGSAFVDAVYALYRPNDSISSPSFSGDARALLTGLSPKPPSCYTRPEFNFPPSCEVSVIVPAYNMERYVGECLNSILSQRVDFTLEVIAINDGSTDGTLDVMRRIASADSRVRLISQDNRGVSSARNVGMDAMRGRCVCFVDSDDAWAAGHLQHLMDALRASDTSGFSSAVFSKMTENGTVLGPVEKTRHHGAPTGRLYRREVWSDIRFPEGYWFEDSVHVYCIEPRYRGVFAKDAGYLRRNRGDSITHTAPRSYRSLDSYWVVEEMLGWCGILGIAIDQQIYDQTIRQFGPLLLERTEILFDQERRALFSLCCSLLGSIAGFDGLQTSMGGRWRDVELALRTGDFKLWHVACRWL